MDKLGTININMGRVFENGPPKNNIKSKPAENTNCITSQLGETVCKLKSESRNLISYLFLDRYTIIYLATNLKINCSLSKVNYNSLDLTNNSCSYMYTSHLITKKNEVSITNYSNLLRLFVANKNPPMLGILHNRLNIYLKEYFNNKVNLNEQFSIKNIKDVVFQILITLFCIYRHGYSLSNIEIVHIYSSSPATLEYKVGNIIFTLQNVVVFPFFNFLETSDVIKTNDPIKITESYNNIANLLLNPRYNYHIPLAESDACECILAYLSMEFKNESNLCKFDEINDKRFSKISNKFCLSTPLNYGRVYKFEDSTYIQLNDNLFFNIETGIIENQYANNMVELFELHENRNKNTNITTYKFDV